MIEASRGHPLEPRRDKGSLVIPDPAELLDDTVAAHSALRERSAGLAIELYRRATWRMRVSRDVAGRRLRLDQGIDQGTAVRVRRVGAHGLGFAAISGFGTEVAEAALRRAIDSIVRPGARNAWWCEAPTRRCDRETSERLPTPDELRRWLEAATATGSPGREGETDGRSESGAWVEAATTVECWAATEGAAGLRTRSRAWAMLWDDRDETRSYPRTFAARSVEGLGVPFGRRSVPEPRKDGLRAGLSGRIRRIACLPEAAAVLVARIVGAVHAHEASVGMAAGPGWVIADEPRHPDGLSGGAFDDALFDSGSTTLADGRAVTASLDGPGFYRRASFMDPPAPAASHLVVDAPDAPYESGQALLDRVEIHPVAPSRWILHGWAVRAADHREVAALGTVQCEVDPRALIRGCLGGFGPPLRSVEGVTTRGLVFDLTADR